jgi:hypothetical protein
MRNIRKALATLGAAGVISGALMVVPAGAAHADTNCGGTVWPDDYVTVRSTTLEGRTIVLLTGRLADGSYGKIRGYRSGDRVWVDRRAPGSSSYFRCGPFNGASTNRLDNFGWEMRACGDIQFGAGRLATCTSWYLDG